MPSPSPAPQPSLELQWLDEEIRLTEAKLARLKQWRLGSAPDRGLRLVGGAAPRREVRLAAPPCPCRDEMPCASGDPCPDGRRQGPRGGAL